MVLACLCVLANEVVVTGFAENGYAFEGFDKDLCVPVPWFDSLRAECTFASGE
jgi:hypothetical protein